MSVFATSCARLRRELTYSGWEPEGVKAGHGDLVPGAAAHQHVLRGSRGLAIEVTLNDALRARLAEIRASE